MNLTDLTHALLTMMKDKSPIHLTIFETMKVLLSLYMMKTVFVNTMMMVLVLMRMHRLKDGKMH